MRRLILLYLGLLPLMLRAQVTISAQLPPSGLMQKEQLWNLIISNNEGKVFDAVVNMTLQDEATGQEVLSASTGSILLDRGIKLITPADAGLVNYNYSAPEYSRNFLPVGIYKACYQLTTYENETPSIAGSDCTEIDVEPLSPPLLNTPYDTSVVQTPYPQFSWMPPTPLDMFTDLSYDIIVAEVIPGQSPSEAIQYNLPVYSKRNILETTDAYPGSYAQLDTSKIYAWQVIARNGLTYAAKTEVWTFKIDAVPQPVDIVESTPFIQLATSGVGKGIAPNGILKVVYFNKDGSKKIKVSIIDVSGNGNEQPVEVIVNATPGENYIQYDLKKTMKLKENKIYVVRIINEQHEEWSARFIVKNYK